MSAFIVSPETMQRCVTAMHDHTQSQQEADELGRCLYNLNREAVAHRYPSAGLDELPGGSIPKDWTWVPEVESCPAGIMAGGGTFITVAVACVWLKALQCLRYQCMEGSEVPATALYKQIADRIGQLQCQIVVHLPEYTSAPWD